MAHYNATVRSPRPIDDVFRYVADFRTVSEWDPSIDESTLTNGGEPIREGAVFHIVAGSGKVEIDFETVELEAPRRIVLKGENDTMVSIDTIEFAPNDEGGTDVTYDADVTLKGVKKLADPVAHLGFQRVGAKARDGLAEKLQGESV